MEDWKEKRECEDAFGKRTDDLEEDGRLMELFRMIEEEEPRPAIVDPARAARLREAYRLVTAALEGEEAEIAVKMHEPFKSFGCINVTFRELVITEPERLGMALCLASNCEAYTWTDGSICLSLGFHGLTRPVY